MREKIIKAIEKCLKENGFNDIKILTTTMGVNETLTEIIGTVKVRAIKTTEFGSPAKLL